MSSEKSGYSVTDQVEELEKVNGCLVAFELPIIKCDPKEGFWICFESGIGSFHVVRRQNGAEISIVHRASLTRYSVHPDLIPAIEIADSAERAASKLRLCQESSHVLAVLSGPLPVPHEVQDSDPPLSAQILQGLADALRSASGQTQEDLRRVKFFYAYRDFLR